MNKVNIGETSSFIGFFSGVLNCLWECYCLQNLTEIPWSTHIYMVYTSVASVRKKKMSLYA